MGMWTKWLSASLVHSVRPILLPFSFFFLCFVSTIEFCSVSVLFLYILRAPMDVPNVMETPQRSILKPAMNSLSSKRRKVSFASKNSDDDSDRSSNSSGEMMEVDVRCFYHFSSPRFTTFQNVPERACYFTCLKIHIYSWFHRLTLQQWHQE